MTTVTINGVVEKTAPRMDKLVGKQQLTDQAIALFRSKGYSATSIAEIVNACGVTKGSLYYHFRSKEELALAAMDQVHRYFTDHVFRFVSEAERPRLIALSQVRPHLVTPRRSKPDFGPRFGRWPSRLGAFQSLFCDAVGRA